MCEEQAIEGEHHRTAADACRGHGNKLLTNTAVIKTIVLREADLSVSLVIIDGDHDLDVSRGRSKPPDRIVTKGFGTFSISGLHGEGWPVHCASRGQIQRPIGLIGFLASGSGIDSLRSDPEQLAIGQVHEGQFFVEKLVEGFVCRLVCTRLHFQNQFFLFGRVRVDGVTYDIASWLFEVAVESDGSEMSEEHKLTRLGFFLQALGFITEDRPEIVQGTIWVLVGIRRKEGEESILRFRGT